MLFTVVFTLALVAFDQLTKYLATTYLAPVGTLPFLPGIMELRYYLNDGAAFSFLSGIPGNRWILIGITSVALAALTLYLVFKKPAHKLEYFSWLLILAGGLGNLVDRICNGVVVDFFATTFINFAVFNVADCYVSVGVALLLITIFMQELRAKKEKDSHADPSV